MKCHFTILGMQEEGHPHPAHVTMLHFDLQKKTIEFFDPTDGAFRYQVQDMYIQANRYEMMQGMIHESFHSHGFTYVKHTHVPNVQEILEYGWTDEVQLAVKGYCFPIVLLVYCLSVRLNVHDLHAVAMFLSLYIREFPVARIFALSGDKYPVRWRLRFALLWWTRSLYYKHSRHIAHLIGMIQNPDLLFDPNEVHSPCATYDEHHKTFCNLQPDRFWTMCHTHRQQRLPHRGHLMRYAQYIPHGEIDVENDTFTPHRRAHEIHRKERRSKLQRLQVKQEPREFKRPRFRSW